MCGSSGWGNNCDCEGCRVYYRYDASYRSSDNGAKIWPPMYMFHPPEERLGAILEAGYMGTLNHRSYHFWGDKAIKKLKLYEITERVE